MKKIIAALISLSILLTFSGCSDFDNEYETVFKQNHHKMDPKTPFQESAKKYLEKIDKLNADIKGKLDLSTLSLNDFNDNSLFKDSGRMALLNESIEGHKQIFVQFWTEYFKIIDEWELEVKGLNEGDNPQFSEEFYKAFSKDFDRYRLRMSNIKFTGDLYFKLFEEFIDFMSIGSNYFLDEDRPIFYNSTTADECVEKLYLTTKSKYSFYNKIEYLQKLWASNLLISRDFNNLEKIELQCYPASGITGEDNFKRHQKIELAVYMEIQQIIAKWEREFKSENDISVMSIKYY